MMVAACVSPYVVGYFLHVTLFIECLSSSKITFLVVFVLLHFWFRIFFNGYIFFSQNNLMGGFLVVALCYSLRCWLLPTSCDDGCWLRC